MDIRQPIHRAPVAEERARHGSSSLSSPKATQREETFTELYWWLLAAAAALVGLGTVLLKERGQLWWQLGTATALVILLMT